MTPDHRISQADDEPHDLHLEMHQLSKADQTNNEDRKCFILDSGASPSHLTTPTRTCTPVTKPLFTKTAANQRHSITHTGNTQIRTPTLTLNITDAVVSPDINTNLISVHTLAKNHGPVTFTPNQAFVRPWNNRASRKIASFRQGLYVIDNKTPELNAPPTSCYNTRSSTTPSTTPETTSKSTTSSKHPTSNTGNPDAPAHNTRSKSKTTHWERPWRTTRSQSTQSNAKQRSPPPMPRTSTHQPTSSRTTQPTKNPKRIQRPNQNLFDHHLRPAKFTPPSQQNALTIILAR